MSTKNFVEKSFPDIKEPLKILAQENYPDLDEYCGSLEWIDDHGQLEKGNIFEVHDGEFVSEL